MATRNLAVMFTDIKGFTARTSDSTRDGMRSMLGDHDRLLRPVFRHFEGTIVKTIGDAFLVHFESPTDAVICGLTIQSVLRKFNSALPEEEQLSVRVAINVGDVEMVDGDILGEPVNIAARLEGITPPGDVWFTEAVYLTMNRKEAPSAEIGERIFKGIPLPVKVYQVISEPPSEQIIQIDSCVRLEKGVPHIQGIGPTRAPGPSWRPWAIAGVLALLIGPLAAVLGYDFMQDRRSMSQIENLMALDDPASALRTIESLLASRPDDTRLRELALEATSKYLDRRLEKGEAPRDVLDWLEEELRGKGHLDPLLPRLALLESEVRLAESMSGPGRDNAFWKTFRELLQRYPDKAEVPLAAVSVLRASNRISQTLLWPYELLIERAGLPDDPQLSSSIWEVCAGTFESEAPSSGYAERAHSIARAHFSKERDAWAREALVGEGGLAILNALLVLEELGETDILEQPFHHALRGMEKATLDPTMLAFLESLGDPRELGAVLEIFVSTRPELRSGTTRESRDTFQRIHKDLRERQTGLRAAAE